MGTKKKGRFNLLVIDDSSTDREIFRLMLENEGYNVKVATGAKEGLSILYDEEIHLILCDYFMPEMDGKEFLAKMRKDPKLRHIGVIIITSDETKEVRIKLLKCGANDFIHKGAAYEEIVARVATHLNSTELANAKSVLEFAGKYAHEMSQPLASLMATADLLEEKTNNLKNKTEKTSFLEIIKKVNEPIDRMTVLIEKIRKLEMDKTKHYKGN